MTVRMSQPVTQPFIRLRDVSKYFGQFCAGIGRNLCIEILEYFDSIGFTKRNENQRTILNPEKIRFGTNHSVKHPVPN